MHKLVRPTQISTNMRECIRPFFMVITLDIVNDSDERINETQLALTPGPRSPLG